MFKNDSKSSSFVYHDPRTRMNTHESTAHSTDYDKIELAKVSSTGSNEGDEGGGELHPLASFFEGSPDIAESNKKYSIRRDEIELLEKVGEGAFGKVYRGKYNLAAVAVKTLKGS